MKRVVVILGLLLSLMAGGANAALYSRAGGTMVYDDVLKITWLADWNYRGQPMQWEEAMNWAANLEVDGFRGWRLPTAFNQDGSGPCSAYYCSSSELGYMFYLNWAATAGSDFSTGTNTANLSLFKNVKDTYSMSTRYAGNTQDVWRFDTRNGGQGYSADFSNGVYSVAVRDGDIANVPLPATIVLLVLGLVGIGAARRKQS
jgi:hypothetical protein